MDILPRDCWNVILSYVLDHTQLVLSFTSKLLHSYIIHDKQKISTRDVAGKGYLNLLLWLDSLKYKISNCVPHNAAMYGHLHILEWITTKKKYTLGRDVMEIAATHGHLHILEWYYQKKPDACQGIVRYAIENGHLHILKWAHKKNNITKKDAHDSAIRHDKYDIFAWLIENDIDCNTATCVDTIIIYNRSEFIICMLTNEKYIKCTGYVCQRCIWYDNVNILKWLREDDKYEITYGESKLALDLNRLNVIKYLYDKYDTYTQLVIRNKYSAEKFDNIIV
jgi:hypothetical protein